MFYFYFGKCCNLHNFNCNQQGGCEEGGGGVNFNYIPWRGESEKSKNMTFDRKQWLNW